MKNQDTLDQIPEENTSNNQDENKPEMEAISSTPTIDLPTEETPVKATEEQGEVLTESTPVEAVAAIPEPAHEEIHTEEHDKAEKLFQEISQDEIQETENFEALIRDELVLQLEHAVNEDDINAAKSKNALIKVAFIRKSREEKEHRINRFVEGGGKKEDFKEEPDLLENRFDEIFNVYKEKKSKYNEEQEKLKQENLVKKQQILDELKILINSEETLKKTYDEFRILQEKWREIGIVPRTEINNLWQNYHFLVEKFFDKVKLNKELKDLDLRKNLEAKIAICEKTEALLLEPSIIKSFRQLQKFHEEWKEVGPAPNDKKDDIWERFRTATDQINQRRRDYYQGLEDEHQNNLDAKTALCEQAENLLAIPVNTTREWAENTNKINELLKIWKSIGPVPMKNNKDIWTRFKLALNTFFGNKKEHFDKIKEQQLNNYNLKFDLCLQAESMVNSTDWKKTSNDLIRLQNEWRNIGPVPKKHSDKIWKRFRAACDAFFKSKSEYFSNIHQHEDENLARKEELIKKVKEYPFGEDKNENLQILQGLQREWTEIGFVPMKEKDRLQTEFRSVINEQMSNLKISHIDMSRLDVANRYENLKNDPNAGRILSREREQLAIKVRKMQEDINLWENNLGFLANSKNADILKEEFQKKIDQAKNDVKVLEAKLKVLKSTPLK
ncbi:MAG: DUF349 domain-containing protein [Bacteroidetes bacterium]|nr:DUF349 domain-containing protein [Bacteroidota bacterium]